MRPISSVSPKPFVVRTAVRAARPVKSAFNPTVVPCPNRTMSQAECLKADPTFFRRNP